MDEKILIRNRLVHLYWNLDNKEVYRILKEKLEDFEKFKRCVIDYLNK